MSTGKSSRITAAEAAANTQTFLDAEADKILDEIYCLIRQMSEGEWSCAYFQVLKYTGPIFDTICDDLRAAGYKIKYDANSFMISWEHLKNPSKESNEHVSN